ncbi:MAG: hypothetical protein HOO00_04355, partial [Rhodospirillaceae bacterium]|nr:hypothetical protein [Rhodospirillaceae bacterium]
MNETSDTYEQMLETLKCEFIDGTFDRLDSLEKSLDGVFSQSNLEGEPLTDFHREIHSLKGLGGTFGFPFMTMVAHRLEDYLADITSLDKDQAKDVHLYIDEIRHIAEAGKDPSEKKCAEILRKLPARVSIDAGTYAKPTDVEVLLVTSTKILGRVVEKELQMLGFRTFNAATSIDALATALRMRPDMVIASATMDGVNGVDICRALHAMEMTREIPFIVLTSFDKGHSVLKNLPDEAAIVRSGDEFAEDFAVALEKLNLDEAGLFPSRHFS